MISRDHGDIIFECDACGETLETNESEFAIAWQMAKRDGWRSKKVFEQWEHSCPDCESKI